MALDLQNAFGLPLGAQALRLLGLAYRAVTLSAIHAVERMATFAVRLLRVHISEGSRVSLRVLRSGDRVEVLGIDAVPVPAGVIHHEAFRDGTVRQPQGKSVRFAVRSPESNDAVAIAVLLSRPENAVTGLHALRLKTGEFFRCGLVHTAPQMVCMVNMATSVAQ